MAQALPGRGLALLVLVLAMAVQVQAVAVMVLFVLERALPARRELFEPTVQGQRALFPEPGLVSELPARVRSRQPA